MTGLPGVGKSHLSIGIAIKAAGAGHRVLLLTLEQLMGKLKRASQENRLERQLQQLTYPKVLVLDEVGYLPLSREDASLLFRLVARRYEKASAAEVTGSGPLRHNQQMLQVVASGLSQ